MPKKLLFLIFLITIFRVVGTDAQENNNWCFGGSVGLDFNSGSPVPFLTGNSFGNPSGTVSDHQGNLLFYTEGNFVWNKLHHLMPNGSDIVTDPLFGSAAGYYSGFYHGASIIIPMPDSSKKYYVFSVTDPDLGVYGGRLYYSIVNMDLDGGLGDVEPGRKSILLDSGITHLNYQFDPANIITGVVGDKCNVWLLVTAYNQQDGPFLKAYSITGAGIDPNVVTSSLNIHNRFGYGQQILVSPDRKKLAYAPNATLYDFDAFTGKISNPLQLQEILQNGNPLANIMYKQIAFSADNTKLYAGAINGFILGTYQFDLSSGDSATIVASKVQIEPLGAVLKLGPDGKIYMSDQGLGTPFLYGTINQPNVSGTACQFIPNTPVFAPGAGSNGFMLPNIVPVFKRDTAYYSKDVTPNCVDSAILLTADSMTGWDYVWNDGFVGTSRSVKEPGVYTLKYHTPPCVTHINTFKINPWTYFAVNLGNDTAVCDEEFSLSASVPNATYLWQDGSTGAQYVADTTGAYWVRVTQSGCSVLDTINLQFNTLKQDLGPDRMLCNNDMIKVELGANNSPGSTVLWSSGETSPSITVTDTGMYWVQVTNAPCIASDTMTIRKQACECNVAVPDAFSPNNDGRNDRFRPVIEPGCQIRGYRMMIYNRWGQLVYQSNQEGPGWDGTFNNVLADIGTYMYTLQMETVAGSKTEQYVRKGDITLIR